MKNLVLIGGSAIAGLILWKQSQKFKSNFTKVLDFDVNSFYDDFKQNAPSFISPDLYKQSNLGYAHLMSEQNAKKYAIALYENLDSPEIIYYVFRQIPSKVQISQVSDIYQDVSPETTGDLYKDLINNLNKFEIAYLNFIIKQKNLAG